MEHKKEQTHSSTNNYQKATVTAIMNMIKLQTYLWKKLYLLLPRMAICGTQMDVKTSLQCKDSQLAHQLRRRGQQALLTWSSGLKVDLC